MLELLSTYLAYNFFLGILLCIFQLVSIGTIGTIQNWLWLLFFPAVGLGKMRFVQTNLKSGIPEYPQAWFMWKYMVKVNWGFMALLGIGPLTLLVLMSLGFWAGDLAGTSSIPLGEEEMRQFLEFGLILMIILYAIIMFFVLIIPFLVFILIPGRMKRSIEKKRWAEFRRQQLAKQQGKSQSKPNRAPVKLLPAISSYLKEREEAFSSIEKDRKKDLQLLGSMIDEKRSKGEALNLTFICTHNSRRSQFGQIWAAVAAAHYGISGITTYSGGTEETSFNKRAVEACRRTGLHIDSNVGTNPHYSIRFSDSAGALTCYSKKFNTPSNPQQNFIAIMTCSDADENCPIVPGAEHKLRLTYDDPKISDQTAEEVTIYDERCAQIATEMLFAFSEIE